MNIPTPENAVLCLVRTAAGFQQMPLIPRVDWVGGKGYELSYQIPGTLASLSPSDVQPIDAGGVK